MEFEGTKLNLKNMIINLQVQEAIQQGKEVVGIGEGASVTTIGVMALLCLLCLGIAITLWKAKNKSDQEHKDLNNNTLEALVTANLIIKNLETKVDLSTNSVNDLKLLISQMIGEIKSSK